MDDKNFISLLEELMRSEVTAAHETEHGSDPLIHIKGSSSVFDTVGKGSGKFSHTGPESDLDLGYHGSAAGADDILNWDGDDALPETDELGEIDNLVASITKNQYGEDLVHHESTRKSKRGRTPFDMLESEFMDGDGGDVVDAAEEGEADEDNSLATQENDSDFDEFDDAAEDDVNLESALFNSTDSRIISRVLAEARLIEQDNADDEAVFDGGEETEEDSDTDPEDEVLLDVDDELDD